MMEYISSFATGFSDLVPGVLLKLLPEAKVIKTYDGMVNYYFNGKEEKINNVHIFNNSFLVIKKYQDKSCDLTSMVRSAISLKKIPASKETFRIRYSVNNQFVRMNKDYTRQIEQKICRLTKSRVDRVSPQTEYWFIKRSENIGYFARLLKKREITEKSLHKGELRPELAYWMCAMGNLSNTSVVMDPFAGYGAIPKQIKKHFHYEKLFVSDIDSELVSSIRSFFSNPASEDVRVRDALNMTDIADHSVDTIITDPPWGNYMKIEAIELFYSKMLSEFSRILKPSGLMVVLTSSKVEFEATAVENRLKIRRRYDTLVNGKKASVYVVLV